MCRFLQEPCFRNSRGALVENDLPDGPAPNLFLVGAPKCGTTSLYEYLRQHPQIFFPADENDYWRTKEPNHFCPELEIQEKYSIKDKRNYFKLYQGSEAATWRGDASPYYLLSESAPERIKQHCPNARILVTLRPPVDMMHSYHRDLLHIHLEDTVDFYDAIGVGTTPQGEFFIRQPGRIPKYLDYFSISRFAPQVERYLSVFGRDSVKILLLEDIATAPKAAFKEILSFLGVDNSFRPEFRVHNETTQKKSPLERCLNSIYTLPGIKQLSQSVLPYPVRRGVLSTIRRRPRHAVQPDPRDDRLRKLCAPDVARLSALLGRNLDHWQSRPRQ
jgi:hypothetical protein